MDKTTMNKHLKAFGLGTILIGSGMAFGMRDQAPAPVVSEQPVVQAQAPKVEAPAPRVQSSWSTKEVVDQATGQRLHVAMVHSSNAINLDFPYAGPQRGTLEFITNLDTGERKIVFIVPRGQIISCSRYTDADAKATWRLVGAEKPGVHPIGCTESSDGRNNLITLDLEEGYFITYVAQAVDLGGAEGRDIIFNVTFFKNGQQTFRFDPRGSLEATRVFYENKNHDIADSK